MLFPTFEFGIFFLCVYAINWLIRDTMLVRKLFLLAASYFFYANWDWKFLSLLILSSTLNYIAGIGLKHSEKVSVKKVIVTAAVVANLVILGFFKYYGFFIDSLTDLLLAFGVKRDLPILEIILPIGISFFTFQGISYVVDIYRKQIKPVESPIDLFLYISFFPQLVAGPIVRASHFLPQLNKQPALTPETLVFGFLLITLGLFKKTILAHYLAVDLVNPVFFSPEEYGTIDLMAAQYAYAIQVYLDFSGYSDIAIGTAALLGFTFRKNFDRPFGSTSIAQLWRRWHISLSTFLRDYLYRALRGGRKESELMVYRNLFLTMLLGGLWHGSAWTFVIWGGLHGIALVVERQIKKIIKLPSDGWKGKVSTFSGWFLTFHMFTLAAIFFRSPDLTTAMTYFQSMSQLDIGIKHFTPMLMLMITGCLATQFLPGDLLERTARQIKTAPVYAPALLFGCSLLLIEAFGPEGVAPFIYYQF